MKGATSAWLYGIWGTDRSNIWAVGFGYMQSFKGVAYQKTGTSSETLKFNRDAALQKIWGTSANDIWMVGDAFENKLGLAHWNGASINTV